jgi:hypothetical protein
VLDAAPLLIGAVLGVGVSLGTLALACLLVGLVLGTVQGVLEDRRARPPAGPPPLVVARTLLPGPVYERPGLPVAPYRPALPRYVIPGRVDPIAPTVVDPWDEVPGVGDTVETTANGSTAWYRMPRPSWATGDRA